ncbi:MAG: beta strand repeat-containing protein, partial [Actinomycetota bacterium]
NTSTASIAKADATIDVQGASVTYDATPHGATGTATGVNGEDLSSGLDLGASFTDVPGGTANWTFTGGTNYNDASNSVAIVIATHGVTVDFTAQDKTYDGSTDAAITGCSLTGVVSGDEVSCDSSSATASFSDADAGADKTVTANGFTLTGADASDYAITTVNTSTASIAKADATIDVQGASVTYDATPHGATGTATGVNGEDLSFGLDLGASFTDVPGGTANWTFTGGTNYNDASNSVAIVIAKAASTVAVDCPVAHESYDGSAHDVCTASANGAGALTQPLTVTYDDNTNAGTVTASATYAGDANHTGNSDAAQFVIDQATSTTTVDCPTDPQIYTGSAIEPCTASYSTSDGLSGSVGVTYTDNVSVGTAHASASYPGDSNHSTSSGSATFEIVRAGPEETTTTIDSTSAATVVGQSYSVSVTVSATDTPAGSVNVSDSDGNTCSITLASGTGACNLSSSSAGTKTVDAHFVGNADFAESDATSASHTVSKASTTTTITSDAPAITGTSTAGQSFDVAYTVAVNSPGAGSPAGNVTVTDGTASCTATVAAGTCSLTLTSAGTHSLTATYAGSTDFNGSTSAAVSHTVSPAALASIVVSPSTATKAAGVAQPYTAQGFDTYGNSRGDVTAGTTWSIAPNGSCSGASCSATVAGAHTVTGNDGGFTNTATLTVTAAAATVVRVETAANGSGTVVAAQTLPAGSSITAYSITRDQYGNFVGNAGSTWSLVSKTGGVVDGDLVAATNGKSATFTGHSVGSAKLHAGITGLTSTDSGTITVARSSAAAVRVETASDGSGVPLPAQNVASGSSVVGYAISRDAGGNFIANVSATWSLVNKTGGVVDGDLATGKQSKSATFTAHAPGSAKMHAVVSGLTSVDSGTLTAVGGSASKVQVETKADGTGTIIPAQTVVAGNSVKGYAIARDAAGNFVGNVAATWSLAGIHGGVVAGDLVAASDGKSATFTGHKTGDAKMTVAVSGLSSIDSGTLTVVAGAAKTVGVETKADGSGVIVAAQNLASGSSLNVFAITRDAYGNFVANAAGTWSLVSKTGGVVNSDLVAAAGNASATFTGNSTGSAQIHVAIGGLTSIDSGTITVVKKKK